MYNSRNKYYGELVEFLLTLILFTLSFVLFSVGRFFGRKQVHTACGGAGKKIKDIGSTCGACNAIEELKFYKDKTDPGFENVARLGYPNRDKRFIDKLDFKPERFK